MMLQAIIVDDEEFARSSLYFLLHENCPEVSIVGIAKSVTEARALISVHHPNLIFLDIAMPGENGFALFNDAGVGNAAVIFTTAYDQYALKAIKANAMDYLLKPIDIEELKEAVQKALKNLNLKLTQPALLLTDENMNSGAEIRKITLPTGQGYRIIDIENIMYVEADSNYSIFHLKNSENLTVSKVLKDYEEILPSTVFLRVHKSIIVNLNYIKEYNSKSGFKVILLNEESLPVSRRRSAEFLDHFKSFIKNT